MTSVSIRTGREEDIPSVMKLIRELAEYEEALEEVINTEDQLLEHGFGPAPSFKLLVATTPLHGVVAMALYYPIYSTWKGKSLYLEDLVVTESQRNLGIGRKLFHALIQIAKEEGAQRLQWQVLDWNTPSIGFYKKVLGAEMDETWINCRLTYNQLQSFEPA